ICSNPCWWATVLRNSFRRESSPKRRVAAVSRRLLDNCAGSFAYSAQRCVLGAVEASASCATQNGNSTFARISATRDSPMSAIFFGDAVAVSVYWKFQNECSSPSKKLFAAATLLLPEARWRRDQ